MRRIAMVGCGLRSAVVNELWRVYSPDGERASPPARERRYARAIPTSSHGRRTLAPLSKPVARPEPGRGTRRSRRPRFEAATRKQMRFGNRRSERRSWHESHRWFTRLTRGGVHDARRAGQTGPESGASRMKSTNTVKVLANTRQKLTRRGGVARRPSRLALRRWRCHRRLRGRSAAQLSRRSVSQTLGSAMR
jgi:hypothetical protein